MQKVRFALIGAAGFVVSLVGTAISANAAVAPHGSFSYSIPGPNSVNTTNIASTTTTLTLGVGFPEPAITSFVDPYLGQPNNFCGEAGGGCTSQHGPGFLFPGSFVGLSDVTLPVSSSPTIITEHVVAGTRFGELGGTIEIGFDFTSVRTTELIPTTAASAGLLTLDFLGTFAFSDFNFYTVGQSAEMTINCTQSAPGGTIACNGTIATPRELAQAVPEPASLVLLGSALFGLGVFRRRISSALASL